MKQMLNVLLFLTGGVPIVLTVLREVHLIQDNKTWSDAQNHCRASYTKLATINGISDMTELQAEAQEQKFISDVWVGLYKESHDWFWSYNSETPAFLNWYPGEPNNVGNNQECGVIYLAGTWGDKNCADLYPSVCYDVSYAQWIADPRMYVYVSTKMSWYEAQSYCRLHHTDLARVKTATENSLLHQMVSGLTWIGLYRITWKWVNQTTLASVTWVPGQPDNLLGGENCGYLSNFQAADARCSDLKPFFCYKETKSHVLKVKVQSDQNMNHPAVKEALLEKILQKLKELGMNVTLTWRKQPGGEVFHKI